MIRRNFSTKNVIASKVSLGKWNEVLTTLPKFFCQKIKHFLTAVKKQYASINFVKKCMYIFSIDMDRKKNSLDKLPKKATPQVRKAFARSPNLVSKRNILLKNCFESELFSAHVACSFHKPAEIFCPQFENFPFKNHN